jgi:hypothetical protein
MDRNEHRRNLPEHLRTDESYSELQRILRFELPTSTTLRLETTTTFAYGIIQAVKLDVDNDLGLSLHFYSRTLSHVHAIDIQFIECLVGRIKLEQLQWAVINQTGSVPQAMYTDNGDNSNDDNDM